MICSSVVILCYWILCTHQDLLQKTEVTARFQNFGFPKSACMKNFLRFDVVLSEMMYHVWWQVVSVSLPSCWSCLSRRRQSSCHERILPLLWSSPSSSNVENAAPWWHSLAYKGEIIAGVKIPLNTTVNILWVKPCVIWSFRIIKVSSGDLPCCESNCNGIKILLSWRCYWILKLAFLNQFA